METNYEVIWKPHEGPQTEFHSRAEDIVLYGGAKGGGKTDSLIGEALRQVDSKNYKAIILRRTYPQLQEIIDRAHLRYPKLGAKWVAALHRYVFPSGASIEFGHCQHEQDKEQYQGKEYSFIGFDQLEQFLESQFTFISAQNRTSDPDLKCYIRATANPGSVGHWWIKRRFIDGKETGKTYTVTYELPDGRKLTRTTCYVRATVYDNPTLLNAQPTYLANLMSMDEIDRRAYLEGDWNAFTTQCVFNSHGMQLQEKKVSKPEWVGFLRENKESYQIIPDDKGNLKIWTEPEGEAEYEIGVDVSEGDEEGDYSSLHVVDKRNWSVVAHWHGHRTPFEIAKIAYDLGFYYNVAELAVEIPGPGHATITKLVEMGYPKLYKYDTDKYGWRSDMATRHNMISTFLDAIREGSVKVKDRDTMDEMYNLIRNPRTQKIEAREGTHDDRVLSLGIALQCIRVNPFEEPTKQMKKMGWFGGRESVVMGGSDGKSQVRRRSTGY